MPRPENAAALPALRGAGRRSTDGVHFVGRLGTYKYYNMDQVRGAGAGLLSQGHRHVRERTCGRLHDGHLELWGGVECTVNRVGDQFFDQIALAGHHAAHRRSGSLRALRLPRAALSGAVGARCARCSVATCDWRWADAALGRTRELGMRPIVGLLHHGSGPAYTSLLDDDFPEKLARYARAVAERYPWITEYTPVNEPLTTARFSGLYGHWYPHASDHDAFVRALLNQLRGTVLAMRAIRTVNPAARLVQTEDGGRTFGRRRLARQVEYEEHRRWLTWDLLAGTRRR